MRKGRKGMEQGALKILCESEKERASQECIARGREGE